VNTLAEDKETKLLKNKMKYAILAKQGSDEQNKIVIWFRINYTNINSYGFEKKSRAFSSRQRPRPIA